MGDILKLARIQILLTVLFIFFKVIRPPVLESASPEIFKTLLLSLPNFFEAVVGIITLTGIGLILNHKLGDHKRIRKQTIYIGATILAAIYVITQEIKIHNLGGNNIYDPNDIIFSVIGLAVGYSIVYFLKPNYPANPL